jgi:hypothetical protein
VGRSTSRFQEFLDLLKFFKDDGVLCFATIFRRPPIQKTPKA